MFEHTNMRLDGPVLDWYEHLMAEYPVLRPCASAIQACYMGLVRVFQRGGKLLLCGNGGSAADAEHIVGELMKGFVRSRPMPEAQQQQFAALGSEGERLARSLQGALPAMTLGGQMALSTAFGNDVDPDLVYAQQVYGYGCAKDALLALSTSGNARNVVLAAMTARTMGLWTASLTGEAGGKLAEYSDVQIRVPATAAYQVQELHLPVYHHLCLMLEAAFFSADGS